MPGLGGDQQVRAVWGLGVADGYQGARWDWYLTSEPTGKVVWCELDAELPEISERAYSLRRSYYCPRGNAVSSRNNTSR